MKVSFDAHNAKTIKRHSKSLLSTALISLVVDRGFEPLWQDWESWILTLRWIHHLPRKYKYTLTLRRKVGDSNPRYGNPYVSLANWWFQPLTQPSKSLEKFLAEPLLSNAMQRYNIFLKPPNFFINFFHISCKSLTFCDKHHPILSNAALLPYPVHILQTRHYQI